MKSSGKYVYHLLYYSGTAASPHSVFMCFVEFLRYPSFLSDFSETEFSRQIVEKYSNTNFMKIRSFGGRVVPCGLAYRRTYVTIPIGAFRNFVKKKTPTKLYILPTYCSTVILLTWRIWWAPNNASKWQMGFNLGI